MEIYLDFTLAVGRAEVYRILGYPRDVEPPRRIVAMVGQAEQEACNLVRPQFWIMPAVVVDVCSPACYLIGDGLSWTTCCFRSEVLATLLEQCDKVVVFLATIGDSLESRVAELAEQGEVLQAFVLDAVGSEAVEQVAELMHQTARRMLLEDGYYCSKRFSPGYCDWDITQQKELFRFFGDAPVMLTEHCLMLPRKSISGIIGVGRDLVQIFNPCRTCNAKDCRGRRD